MLVSEMVKDGKDGVDADAVTAGATYDITKDRDAARKIGDTRKPKLTLRKLNRLKKIRAQNKLEALKREDLLGVMYAPAEDAGGGGGMPGF